MPRAPFERFSIVVLFLSSLFLFGCSCVNKIQLQGAVSPNGGSAAVEFDYPDCCPTAEQRKIALHLQQVISNRFDDYSNQKITREEFNNEQKEAADALQRVVFICQAAVVTHPPAGGAGGTKPGATPPASPATGGKTPTPKSAKKKPSKKELIKVAEKLQMTLVSPQSSPAQKLDAKIGLKQIADQGVALPPLPPITAAGPGGSLNPELTTADLDYAWMAAREVADSLPQR
jgi:hypothetical protein